MFYVSSSPQAPPAGLDASRVNRVPLPAVHLKHSHLAYLIVLYQWVLLDFQVPYAVGWSVL